MSLHLYAEHGGFSPLFGYAFFCSKEKVPPEWRDAPGRFAAQIVSPFIPLWKKMPPERRDAHGRFVPQNCLFLRPERRDAPGFQFIAFIGGFSSRGKFASEWLDAPGYVNFGMKV